MKNNRKSLSRSSKFTFCAAIMWAFSQNFSYAKLLSWSYTFESGEMVLGTLEAEIGAVHLTNITRATFCFVSADGIQQRTNISDNLFLHSWGPQIIPVDGSTDGLRLSFEDDNGPRYFTNFSILGDRTLLGSISSEFLTDYNGPEIWQPHMEYEWGSRIQYLRNEDRIAGWKLYGVPDVGDTIIFLGVAMAGLFIVRRRQRARSL